MFSAEGVEAEGNVIEVELLLAPYFITRLTFDCVKLTSFIGAMQAYLLEFAIESA